MLGAAAPVQALPYLALSNPQSSSMNVQLPHPDTKLLWASLPAIGSVGPGTTAYIAGSPASWAMLCPAVSAAGTDSGVR